MARKPRVWTPPKSGMSALRELQMRHQIERKQLLEELMADSRDKYDELMPELILEGNTQIEFTGAEFIEVLPPLKKEVVEGE